MISQLARLFNVRRDEFRRLLIISIMMVFFIVGVVWANVTIIADFLESLEGDSTRILAYLFIGDAVIIVVTFAVYSIFADRFANNTIMAGLTITGIGGIAVGAFLLTLNLEEYIPSLFLYLVFRSITEAISTHWGPLVNDYFDTRAAKRIFTLLAAVVRVSYLFGSLTILLLNDVGQLNLGFQIQLLHLGMFIWFVTLIAMAAFSFAMPRLMGVTPASELVATQTQSTSKGYWQNLYEGYQFAFRSRYLRAFVAVSVLMMVLQSLMYFEILRHITIFANSAPAVEAGSTTVDTFISDFFSNIIIWGSILLLPFQLFFFVRLVAWAGVERVNLVFPVTSLIAAIVLSFIPLQLLDNFTATLDVAGLTIFYVLAIVTIAEFNRTVLNIGIRAVNDEFLYNAVPVRVKGRIRGFISGLVEPFGTLLVGLMLLIPAIVDVTWVIPVLLITFGIGYVIASIWLSREYGLALISMIEEENFSFMLEANNRIAFDGDTLKSLENRFRQAQDDDTKLLMARLLTEANGANYIELLKNAAEEGSKYLRAGLIDTFVSADMRSPAVIDMCVKYIVDSDARVRKSAITGLKQLVGVQSERYLLAALELLNDNDPSLVAEVLPDLISTRDFYFLQHATQTLNELLEHDDPQQRAIGVNILGETNSPRVLLLLLRYIIDRSQVVRLQSVLAIENLSSSVQVTDELVQALTMTVSSLLRDPLDRIRLSAVRIIANLHPGDFAERIMPALLDDNLDVREVAAELLIKHPNETSKTFMPLMESGHGLMGRMTTSVMVRINRKHESRIYEHIDRVLQDIFQNINRMLALQSLKKYPVIDVVESILLEENGRYLDEIFYMLGSVHGMENVNIAVEALRSSVPRTRANGIEAIDVMLNLHLLTAIETVTNPEHSLEELDDYGSRTYTIDTYAPQQVLVELLDQHNEDWIVYIGIEVLAELGKQLFQAENQPASQSPLDLLSAVSSGGLGNKVVDDIPFTLEEIQEHLDTLKGELPIALRSALRKARNSIQGVEFERSEQSIGDVISEVERIIFLKRVQFFQDITINKLRKVANVCHEVWYDAGQTIFNEGDIGGSLYVIVEGRVGIERKQEDGKSARLDTLRSEASFGEDTLFDQSRHSTSAITLSRTLLMRLDTESLMALIQSYPEMSMNIIRVLSQQIRQIDRRITSIARQDSKADSLFDKLGI